MQEAAHLLWNALNCLYFISNKIKKRDKRVEGEQKKKLKLGNIFFLNKESSFYSLHFKELR